MPVESVEVTEAGKVVALDAVFMIRALITSGTKGCRAEDHGGRKDASFWIIKAAVPATSGAAIEVPLR
jgi:hypothetical protein